MTMNAHPDSLLDLSTSAPYRGDMTADLATALPVGMPMVARGRMHFDTNTSAGMRRCSCLGL
jgi:hypothetical protein